MALLIQNGTVIDPANDICEQRDVLVENGRIARIEAGCTADGAGVIDAAGLVVAPGLIDLHVHFREPGQEYKETVRTGAAAAAAGGFTTVCCMPNTVPAIHDRAIVEHILGEAVAAGMAKVLPMAAASMNLAHEQLTELADLRDAGCICVSDDGKPIQNSLFLRRVMQYAAMLDFPLSLHCEDLALTDGGVMNEGRVSTLLGLKGMPREAEEVATARAIVLAKYAGCRIHLEHVSTRHAVELVRRARHDGVRITAEAAPHHFSLTDEAVRGYDAATKMVPPLRTEDDVAAVIEGLRDGTLDAIASDHAPHAHHEKEVEYNTAPFGIVGLETELALSISQLCRPGVMELPEVIRRLTIGPARALGLSGGTLSVGAPADIVIFDVDAEWTVDVNRFHSKSKNSPYHGMTLRGRVRQTLVNGRVVFAADHES